jgi:glycosyltransferase involved in cell wall biosynthesis
MQLFYPYTYGGGEWLFFLIAREMAKRGHNVSVISQRLEGTDAFEKYEGIKIYRVGRPVLSTGLPPEITYHLRYIISASRKGREIIKKISKGGEKIDIIHSNVYVPAVSAYLCSRFYHLPHLVTFHVVYQAQKKDFWKIWTAKLDKKTSSYAGSLAKFIEKTIIKMNLSGFHAVTEITKQDLITIGAPKEKIHVIPNGIDLAQYEDDIGQSDITVEPNAVFVGRLQAYKNIGTIIRAFRKVIEIIPEARLIIVGDGPDRDSLLGEAKPISEHVMFTGRLSQEQKVRIIKKSSFMVLPSIIEGFPMTIIESFACAKPIIVSSVRPLSDIVKHGYTGLLVPPPFGEDKWAQEIIQLFSDKQNQYEMGKNAYNEFLSNYKVERIASLIERLYERVAKEKSSPPIANGGATRR